MQYIATATVRPSLGCHAKRLLRHALHRLWLGRSKLFDGEWRGGLQHYRFLDLIFPLSGDARSARHFQFPIILKTANRGQGGIG